MSDRVRFGTTNDTVTPANSSGFNGFPFSPTVIATKSAGQWLDRTFAECIKIIWRIKKVRMIINSTWTEGTAPTRTYYTIAYNAVLDFPRSAAPHVSENAIWQSPYAYFQFNSPDLPVTYTLEAGGSGSGTWPWEVSGTMKYVTDLAGFSFLVGFGTNRVSIDGTGGAAGSITIFGVSFNTHGVGTTIDPIMTGSMEVEEYWPYAALDASPIYNTTTGAQLQSPLN